MDGKAETGRQNQVETGSGQICGRELYQGPKVMYVCNDVINTIVRTCVHMCV